jgi:hypothetical protein
MVFTFRALAVLLTLTCLSAGEPGARAIAGAFAQELKLPSEPEPVLQKILETREFKDSATESLRDSFQEWKDKLWKRIIEYLWPRIPEAEWFDKRADVVWVVLGCLLLAVVLVLAYLTVRRFMRRDGFGAPSALEIEEPLTRAGSAEIKNKAFELAGKGDYSFAVINLFRYVLVWLDEHNRIALYSAKTNREILRALQNDPAGPIVLQLAPIFSAVRYGNARCDKSDYERYLSLCLEIAET